MPCRSGWFARLCWAPEARYDFNDALLAIGASYWATLVERELAA